VAGHRPDQRRLVLRVSFDDGQPRIPDAVAVRPTATGAEVVEDRDIGVRRVQELIDKMRADEPRPAGDEVFRFHKSSKGWKNFEPIFQGLENIASFFRAACGRAGYRTNDEEYFREAMRRNLFRDFRRNLFDTHRIIRKFFVRACDAHDVTRRDQENAFPHSLAGRGLT